MKKDSLAKNNSLKPKSSKNGKDKKKRSNKKRIIWAVIAVVVILSVVGGFFALQGLGIPVETAEAETNDVAITVFATGAVTPGSSRDVYPETQGLIESVRVQEGDMVEEGDILATLDGAVNQAQLSQAQAGLAQARSGLSQAESAQQQADAGGSAAAAGVTAAQAGVDAATAARDAARIGLDSALGFERFAERELAEFRQEVDELIKLGIFDPEEAEMMIADMEMHIEEARLGVAQARAGVAQADAGVAQARAGVEQARAGVTQAGATETGSAISAARAGVTAAEDAVALAEDAVEATIIRAPKDGMVLFAPTAASAAALGTGITPTSGTEIMRGSAVAPGSPIFTVVDEALFSFTAEIDEVDVRRIAEGQAAEVTLSSYSGRTFEAEVSNISKLAMPTMTGGTVFEVELSFTEDVPDARIGMRGDTTIEIETKTDVLTIPIDAWFSEAGENFVYLIDGENQLVRTPITVGASTEFVVEIVDGIEAGDVVAMASGAPVPLEDGMQIMIAP
ncbi:MAG: efflux RND transporter periplasmic adaptor subunit [Coriobacteriia bacterium]|nr:efflux RND transporter periplasmic adaptor subunit [Coriobacteriia bacterium]